MLFSGDRRTKIYATAGGLVMVCLLGFLAWRIADDYSLSRERSQRLSATNVAVRVATVVSRDIAAKYTFAGKLEPAWNIDVSPQIEGRIDRLLVSEGDVVSAGAIVAILDTRELAGQVASAEANLAAARGSLAQAQGDLKRSEGLAGFNAISKQTLENDRIRVDIAKAQVAAAAANADSVRARLNNGRVLASRSGVVAKQYQGEGAYARPGLAIINLAGEDEMVARLVVTEPVARVLANGATVQMRVEALSRTVAGKVTRTVALSDQAELSYAVTVSFPNADRRLKSGMTASGEASGPLVRNAAAIPAQAVISREGRKTVFVIMKDGVTDQRNIKAGVSDGAWVEVLEGLTADERVVVSGLDKMQDGMRVNVQ
jgi:RND family efflux transporter MFP subunit